MSWCTIPSTGETDVSIPSFRENATRSSQQISWCIFFLNALQSVKKKKTILHQLECCCPSAAIIPPPSNWPTHLKQYKYRENWLWIKIHWYISEYVLFYIKCWKLVLTPSSAPSFPVLEVQWEVIVYKFIDRYQVRKRMLFFLSFFFSVLIWNIRAGLECLCTLNMTGPVWLQCVGDNDSVLNTSCAFSAMLSALGSLYWFEITTVCKYVQKVVFHHSPTPSPFTPGFFVVFLSSIHVSSFNNSVLVLSVLVVEATAHSDLCYFDSLASCWITYGEQWHSLLRHFWSDENCVTLFVDFLMEWSTIQRGIQYLTQRHCSLHSLPRYFWWKLSDTVCWFSHGVIHHSKRFSIPDSKTLFPAQPPEIFLMKIVWRCLLIFLCSDPPFKEVFSIWLKWHCSMRSLLRYFWWKLSDAVDFSLQWSTI